MIDSTTPLEMNELRALSLWSDASEVAKVTLKTRISATVKRYANRSGRGRATADLHGSHRLLIGSDSRPPVAHFSLSTTTTTTAAAARPFRGPR